jgi:hypothetical protein
LSENADGAADAAFIHSKTDMKDEARAGLISEFWAWFDSYRDGIDGGTLPQVEEQHLEEIVERLGGIESGLAVELSVREDGVKELTISADGVRDNFAVVEQIVSQAIALPRSDTMTSRSCLMNRRQKVCCHFQSYLRLLRRGSEPLRSLFA